MNKPNGITSSYLRTHGLIKAQQLDRPTIEAIFATANRMQTGNYDSQALRGRVVITLFYERSTRTRVSFEMAAHKLGANVISIPDAPTFSSVGKGETLRDTLMVIGGYGPATIIIRYDKKGGLEEAPKFAGVPIINAGDGTGQHPTQALLDLYTIVERFGKIEGLHIAMVGDLANGRTVRSNCYLLAKHFPHNTIHLVSPAQTRMGEDVKRYLKKHQVVFHESEALDDVLSAADVVYQTRVQAERFKDRATLLEEVKRASKKLVIDQKTLALMKKEAIILHPLPRVDEIDLAVDADPRAWYFKKQTPNGLFIRMALLEMILGANH